MKTLAIITLIAAALPFSCHALSLTPVNYPDDGPVFDLVWDSGSGVEVLDTNSLKPWIRFDEVVDYIDSIQAQESITLYEYFNGSWRYIDTHIWHFGFDFSNEYDRRLSQAVFNSFRYDFEALESTEYGARIFAKDSSYASRVPDGGSTLSLFALSLAATFLSRRKLGTAIA